MLGREELDGCGVLFWFCGYLPWGSGQIAKTLRITFEYYDLRYSSMDICNDRFPLSLKFINKSTYSQLFWISTELFQEKGEDLEDSSMQDNLVMAFFSISVLH